MGLGAYVRCRCWEDGNITSPPPFAEHVRLDSEDCLDLDLPWDENQEKHEVFNEWLGSCCAHPDMRQAEEHISNWTGYRLFQQQMRAFGLEHFPVLTEVLPEVNGGQAPAEKAAAALKELDKFCTLNFGERVELVSLDTGETIHSYVEAYEGIFHYAPTGNAGVDPEGFFVRHGKGEDQEEVFRSMRFSQEYLGRTEVPRPAGIPEGATWPGKGGRKKFKLTDIATGRSIITALGVCTYHQEPSPDGELQEVYPMQVEVQRRQMKSSDFLYILKPLRIVFKASLQTGNPVCWT